MIAYKVPKHDVSSDDAVDLYHGPADNFYNEHHRSYWSVTVIGVAILVA